MRMPWMIPTKRIPTIAPMKKTQSARLTRAVAPDVARS